MSDPIRTATPQDRLTRLCAAMTDALEAHPEHGSEKCAVFLRDGNRMGLVLHGYDDDREAIVDLFGHLRAIFRANGQDLHVVPVGTTPPKERM